MEGVRLDAEMDGALFCIYFRFGRKGDVVIFPPPLHTVAPGEKSKGLYIYIYVYIYIYIRSVAVR